MLPTWADLSSLPTIPAWALVLWSDDHARLGLLALTAGLVLAIVLPAGAAGHRVQHAAPAPPKQLPKLGPPSLVERAIKRPVLPVKAGGVTFDRSWRHVGIIATTGARKSTALASLADQLGVPCVVITGDHAPPLVNWTYSVGGWVWYARGGVAWYPWGGPLELAVQRAEYMHPSTSGDVGVGRAMFKQAARIAWGAADQRGEHRTLGQLISVLPTTIRGQVSAMMVENWTARLRELEQSLGDSLGTDLDIVEALRAGISVMVSLNSFQDVANRKRFASIAVLEALRAADMLGNIGVIIDEVGLIGGDLFGDAVRTFRVRKVVGLFASQIAQDFPPEVRGNVNVWFLGQQSGGDRQSRQWASDTTFGLIPPEQFGEHALPHGRFYVVHGGRVELATIPTWQDLPMRMPRELPVSVLARPTPAVANRPPAPSSESKGSETLFREGDSEEVDSEDNGEVVYGPVEMPRLYSEAKLPQKQREQLANIWMHHRFPRGLNGCHESTYHRNNRGRPSCSLGGADWTCYVLIKALDDAVRLGLDEQQTLGHLSQVKMLTAAGELTVDHVEGCENEICDRPEHLAWEGRGRNTELYYERQAAAAD